MRCDYCLKYFCSDFLFFICPKSVQMKMKQFKIYFGIVFLAFSNFAYSVPTWQMDGSGQYSGATGIDINGSSYDVALFGASWDDAVAAFDPDPIYSFAFATAARYAFHRLVFDPNNANSVNFVLDLALSAVAPRLHQIRFLLQQSILSITSIHMRPCRV